MSEPAPSMVYQVRFQKQPAKNHTFRHLSELKDKKGGYLEAEVLIKRPAVDALRLEFSLVPLQDTHEGKLLKLHPNVIMLSIKSNKKAKKRRRNDDDDPEPKRETPVLNPDEWRCILEIDRQGTVHHINGDNRVLLPDVVKRLPNGDLVLHLGKDKVMLTVVKALQQMTKNGLKVKDVLKNIYEAEKTVMCPQWERLEDLNRIFLKDKTVTLDSVRLRVRTLVKDETGQYTPSYEAISEPLGNHKNAATTALEIEELFPDGEVCCHNAKRVHVIFKRQVTADTARWTLMRNGQEIREQDMRGIIDSFHIRGHVSEPLRVQDVDRIELRLKHFLDLILPPQDPRLIECLTREGYELALKFFRRDQPSSTSNAVAVKYNNLMHISAQDGHCCLCASLPPLKSPVREGPRTPKSPQHSSLYSSNGGVPTPANFNQVEESFVEQAEGQNQNQLNGIIHPGDSQQQMNGIDAAPIILPLDDNEQYVLEQAEAFDINQPLDEQMIVDQVDLMQQELQEQQNQQVMMMHQDPMLGGAPAPQEPEVAPQDDEDLYENGRLYHISQGLHGLEPEIQRTIMELLNSDERVYRDGSRPLAHANGSPGQPLTIPDASYNLPAEGSTVCVDGMVTEIKREAEDAVDPVSMLEIRLSESESVAVDSISEGLVVADSSVPDNSDDQVVAEDSLPLSSEKNTGKLPVEEAAEDKNAGKLPFEEAVEDKEAASSDEPVIKIELEDEEDRNVPVLESGRAGSIVESIKEESSNQSSSTPKVTDDDEEDEIKPEGVSSDIVADGQGLRKRLNVIEKDGNDNDNERTFNEEKDVESNKEDLIEGGAFEETDNQIVGNSFFKADEYWFLVKLLLPFLIVLFAFFFAN